MSVSSDHRLLIRPRAARLAQGIALRRVFAGIVAWCMGCGTPTAATSCFTNLEESATTNPRQLSWTTISDPMLAQSLDGGGVSAAVALPIAASMAVVRISAATSAGAKACVQVDQAFDDKGTTWVSAPASGLDYGDYCQSCPQRVSVGVGSALFVLPSGEPTSVSASQLTLRVGQRDCTTMLPAGSGGLSMLRLQTPIGLAAPATTTSQGEVRLQVAITPGSVFYDNSEVYPAELAAAVKMASALLAPAGLSLRVVRVRRMRGEDPLVVERGDHAALDRAMDTLFECEPNPEARDDRWVPVLLTGCLKARDPLLGQSSEVDGLVSHIPGGFTTSGVAHGVFLKGRSCFGGSAPLAWESAALGKLLAHELGHYLGLYHSVESDGTQDTLTDTGADNLMNYRPFLSGSTQLSAGQSRVMRRHPAVFWE